MEELRKLTKPPQSVMSLIFPLVREAKYDGDALKCRECETGPWSRTFAGYCKMCFNAWCEEMKQKDCKITWWRKNAR